MTDPCNIGFGVSGALGQKWFSQAKAVRLVHHAIELGIREFDTGNFYQQGRAETRLGVALGSAFEGAMIERSALCISSKTGTHIAADGRVTKDFCRDAILRDVETSLRRLCLDTLDILYLHGPNEHQLLSSLPILDELKRQKLIHASGVCTDGASADIAAQTQGVDVLMCSYNIFDRRHGPALKVANKHGKKTVAISAMAQGLYRRSMLVPKSPSDVWYLARALTRNREKLARARSHSDSLALPGWTRSAVALAFCLANENVDVAMTTTSRAANLAANVAAAKRPLPMNKLAQLRALEILPPT